MSTEQSKKTILALRDVTVELPNGRTLLSHVDFDVLEGELVVLVGLSGAGKTTLLKLIAGLLDFNTNQVQLDGTITWSNPNSQTSATPRAGLVFQNHALFDELSAKDNVQFAIDHRLPSTNPGESSTKPNPHSDVELLNLLGVPLATPLANLSGGERQRVALARTLAMEPAVLLFDEPTTGLDPVRSQDVINLILQTNKQRGTTTIVVTHDYQPFLKTDARLVLLDMHTSTITDVDQAALEHYFDHARSQGQAKSISQTKSISHARSISADKSNSVANSTLPLSTSFLRRWISGPGEAVISLGLGLVAIGQGWKHGRWKMRYFWHYLRMVCLGPPLIYSMVAGAMLGFVFTTFSFSQIPYSNVLVPLLTEEFLAATGYSTYRIVVPLMIAVLLAGKCGASIAADVGSRKLAGQFDAMVNLGASPSAYLHGNIVLAMIVAMPIITAAAYVTNCYASLVAYLMAADSGTRAVFMRNYFSMTWLTGQVLPRGTHWVLLKALLGGWIIGSLSYMIGARTKKAPPDVSRDVGKTILWTSLAVLLAHSIISLVEFD